MAFCEPLAKGYDFDQELDSHQQRVVTNCIKHIGLFEKDKENFNHQTTVLFKEISPSILENHLNTDQPARNLLVFDYKFMEKYDGMPS